MALEAVYNAGGVWWVSSGTLAERPVAGVYGRLYLVIDPNSLSWTYDTGASWISVGASEAAASILTKLLTVDADDSGLNANFLQGKAANEFLLKAGDTMTGALVLAADPVSALQPVTKQMLDALLSSLDAKPDVRLASNNNHALTGAQTVDGVAVVTGNRILLKNQTAGAENGVWVASTTGAWTRAADADTASKIKDMYTFVAEGSTNKDTGWLLTTDAITLGTTTLVYGQFSGPGSTLAGTGLTRSGNTISASFGSVAGTIAQGNDVRLRTIQDEGAGLTNRAILDFIGTGVIVEDDSVTGRTKVTISGDAAGAASETAAGVTQQATAQQIIDGVAGNFFATVSRQKVELDRRLSAVATAKAPYRVPFGRLTAYAASSEFNTTSLAKEKAVDGIDNLTGGGSGWVTTQKAVSSLAGENISIAVGPLIWVTMGDSLTEGLYTHTRTPTSTNAPPNAYENYDNPFGSYQFFLQEMQGRYVRNAGAGGERTDQMLARMSADVYAWKPAVCSVLAGTNDMIQDIALATIQANLTSIWDGIVANGTTPVLCTIPPINNNAAAGRTQKMADLNNWIRAQAQTRGVPLADTYAVMNDPANPGQSRPGDNSVNLTTGAVEPVHFTEQGYERLATAFEPVVTQLGRVPRLVGLGISTGQVGTGLADYIKPTLFRIDAQADFGQTFGGRNYLFFDYTPDQTKRWIDHVPIPASYRNGYEFAQFKVILQQFGGTQTLSKYSGLGEVRVYLQ